MRALVLYPTFTEFGRRYRAPQRLFSLTFTAFRSPFFRMESGTGSRNNINMVENLKRFGVISSQRVAQVMENLDRGLFVPIGSSAYVDSPIPIGYNATISAPHMHATCLQLLEDKLKPGMSALDVGSGYLLYNGVAMEMSSYYGTLDKTAALYFIVGTGYLTGCFALMVGSEGRVVGVDHIPELVDMSIKNIKKSVAASLLNKGSLSLHVGDGRKGWQEFAPYDAIHVGAAASEIPQPLLDQLKPSGRMVIPLGTYFQELKVINKSEDGSIKVHTETSVRYVPLTSRDEQLGGF